MSKSLGNCIYLAETAQEVKKKVMSMYTDPTHIHIEDPGHIEGNTVFTYLDAFSRPEHFAAYWPEYQCLDEVKEHYQRGGLGDMKVKKFLNNILQEELTPFANAVPNLKKTFPPFTKCCEKAAKKLATLPHKRSAMCAAQ